MGNKFLRPPEFEPNSGFNDDQISYLRDKFEILSENNVLNVERIS